jgi:hypothetical protein
VKQGRKLSTDELAKKLVIENDSEKKIQTNRGPRRNISEILENMGS